MTLSLKEITDLMSSIGTLCIPVIAFYAINTWRRKINQDLADEFLVALYQYESALLCLRQPYSNYREFVRSIGLFDHLVTRYETRVVELEKTKKVFNASRIKAQARWGDFLNLKCCYLFYAENQIKHQIDALMMSEDKQNREVIRKEFREKIDRNILYAKPSEKDDDFALDIKIKAHEIEMAIRLKLSTLSSFRELYRSTSFQIRRALWYPISYLIRKK